MLKVINIIYISPISIMLNMIIGLLLSTIIFSFSTHLNIFSLHLKIKYIFNNVETAVWEEFMWRMWIPQALLYIFLFIGNNYIFYFLAYLVSSILFIYRHRDINYDKRDFFIFTFMLTIMAIMLPYSNIGLHIGRNALVDNFNSTKI